MVFPKPLFFVKEMLLIKSQLFTIADVNYISDSLQRRKNTKPV
jgi:hypothetical protein